jgi:glycosyltransferase involved in cell wall biosynthesis
MNPARVTIVHVYKDFHIYNALFGSMLLLAKHTDFKKYNLVLCVFSYRKNPWGDEFERLGGKIVDLGAKNAESPTIIFKLRDYFRKERPQIVQTYELKANLYGRIAARLAKVPIIIGTNLTLKDTAPTPLRRLRDRCLHPINRMLDRSSSKVVTSSDYVRKEWDASLASPLYQTIYTPCSFDRNTRASSPSPELAATFAAMDRERAVRIGVVSRLSEEKGVQYLIQAIPLIAKQFPEFRIYIAGDGAFRGELLRLVKSFQAESRVRFLGHLEDVQAFLQRIDLFVLASRSESSSVAVMEAMSMGLAVVATRVGGMSEIVAHGQTGILVPPGDPGQLADAIIRLGGDAEKRKRMGAAGRAVVAEKFQVDQFIKQTFGLYDELLKRKGLA